MRFRFSAVSASLLISSCFLLAQDTLNQLGPYGPWLSDKILTDGPARMSFRTGNWKNVKAWQNAGRQRVLECIAPSTSVADPSLPSPAAPPMTASISNSSLGSCPWAQKPKRSSSSPLAPAARSQRSWLYTTTAATNFSAGARLSEPTPRLGPCK